MYVFQISSCYIYFINGTFCGQSHLLCVDAFRHGPCGDDVVHHPFAQALGNLIELQEVPDIVEHLMVAVGVGIHLLEDGGHISKDGGIKESWRRGTKAKARS